MSDLGLSRILVSLATVEIEEIVKRNTSYYMHEINLESQDKLKDIPSVSRLARPTAINQYSLLTLDAAWLPSSLGFTAFLFRFILRILTQQGYDMRLCGEGRIWFRYPTTLLRARQRSTLYLASAPLKATERDFHEHYFVWRNRTDSGCH
jgi:hypothetical protein